MFRIECTLQELQNRKNSSTEMKAAKYKAKTLATNSIQYSLVYWVDANRVSLVYCLLFQRLSLINNCSIYYTLLDIVTDIKTSSINTTSGKMTFSIITYCNFFFVRIHKCLNKSSSFGIKEHNP